MKKIICHLDMSQSNADIKERLGEVWGEYMAYHIFNVPKMDIEKTYEELAEHLGEIRLCHSANDKNTAFSKSRDIKPDPNLPHYFASNTRQPLHTDYAYYESSESPEWLMLYCIKPSDLGGKTHLISTATLDNILSKYNPTLLEDIKTDITWMYTGDDGDKMHKKPIYEDGKINWNYWQIKEEFNDEKIMNIRTDFHNFLEDYIVSGGIYDFSKTWKSGDCIIFNDKYNLHCRDAFLGDRWLKDHAFYANKQTNK